MTTLREAAQQAIALICSARLCEVNSMSSRQEMLRLLIEATDLLRAALAQANAGNPITDYWFEHYVKRGLCSLCGNYGVIDTRGTRTPAGVAVGALHFCICPNGQKLREAGCALAQEPEPEQEPVAWMWKERVNGDFDSAWRVTRCEPPPYAIEQQPLYTAPTPRKPETEQEPVAWMVYTEGGTSAYVTDNPNDLVGAYRALAIYTAPPQRPRLTDEEILRVLRLAPPEPSLWPHLKDEAVVGDVQRAVLAIARAVERKVRGEW